MARKSRPVDPKLQQIDLAILKLRQQPPSQQKDDALRSMAMSKNARLFELETQELQKAYPDMRIAGQRPDQVFVLTWGDGVNCRVIDLRNKTAYPNSKLKTVLARGGWQKPQTTLKPQEIAALADWNAHRVPGRY